MSQEADFTRSRLRDSFKALRTPSDVADLLGISYSRLAYYVHGVLEVDRYRRFEIKKRSGGVRQIDEPVRTLKIAQQSLNKILQAIYDPRPCVHGFVADRNIATNAGLHARRRFVLNIDLEDFFPSINFGRVRGMFLKFPYDCDPAVATFLAQLCVYRDRLPQGAPTSPTISNMIAARLDRELERLARKEHCAYSRYADDITFSTNAVKFPWPLARHDAQTGAFQVGADLERVIKSNGFAVNIGKVRLQHSTYKQEVTGLIVNRRVNVPRTYIRQVRAMLHAWEKYGLPAASREFFKRFDTKDRAGFKRSTDEFSTVVKGKIDYLKMIRGEDDGIVRRFLGIYADLNPKFVPRPVTNHPAHLAQVFDSVWVLECEDTYFQGTAFALADVGLITCEHVLGKATHAYKADRPDERFPIAVVYAERAFDLALVSINAPLGSSLKKGRSDVLGVGSPITVVGYPNHALRDSGVMMPGNIVGYRTVSTVRRMLVSAPIIQGGSGGPVLDDRGKVIGVAVTGADKMENADKTEAHGVIPIETIDRLVEQLERHVAAQVKGAAFEDVSFFGSDGSKT